MTDNFYLRLSLGRHLNPLSAVDDTSQLGVTVQSVSQSFGPA